MYETEMPAENDDAVFRDCLDGLQRGDFSRLEPLFADAPRVIRWQRDGKFSDHPDALSEALTCACFLGRTDVAEYLLTNGVDPSAGNATGMDALHWAGNRGQLESVRLLLRRHAPLETRSMYGATVLGTAVWSAIHEPRPNQLRIIEELIAAGANVDEVPCPTGDERIDELLRRSDGVNPRP